MQSIAFPAFETLAAEVKDGAAIITVNRAAQLNALNLKVLHELSDAVNLLEDVPGLVALILTGAGPKAFVAGADIAEMETMSHAAAEELSEYGQDLLARIEALAIPTIAAVNGYALGGGNELAMSCDMRVAAKNARFGQPEVGLGIIPGFGGTQRLTRLVGKARAMELLTTGRSIDADEAMRIGLVNRVVAEGSALVEALAVAAEIGKRSPMAVRQVKKAVLDGLPLNEEDGLLVERRLFGECFTDPDHKEGMRAFLEKRPPAWRQR